MKSLVTFCSDTQDFSESTNGFDLLGKSSSQLHEVTSVFFAVFFFFLVFSIFCPWKMLQRQQNSVEVCYLTWPFYIIKLKQRKKKRKKAK